MDNPIKTEKVSFLSNGLSLSGSFRLAPDSRKGVIFAHGITVDKDDEGIFVRAEKQLNKLGFSTLRFDFRGHGQSEGKSEKVVTISGELADLQAAVRFMGDRGSDWIGIAGASFGGGIAALYAGTHPGTVKALLLANPVLDFKKAFLEPTTEWRREQFATLDDDLAQKGYMELGSRRFKLGREIFEEMKTQLPYYQILGYTGPLLVVHGTNDEKIPYADVKGRFDRYGVNKNWELFPVEGAHHGFHEEPYEGQVVNLIVAFFTKDRDHTTS